MVIKSSSVVKWDRLDYVKEDTRQVLDTHAYREIELKKKRLAALVGTSDQLFKNFKEFEVFFICV